MEGAHVPAILTLHRRAAGAADSVAAVGGPMAVILMLTCYCLLKALRIDASKGSGLPEARELQERTLRRDGTGSRQQSLSTD